MHNALPCTGTPGSDPGQEPLPWRVFRAFHHVIKAQHQLVTRSMSGQDVHPAQALGLRALAHNEGMTQRDLADTLRVARPTVTVMLQKMEQAGLVERRVDTADQRYTRIYLTEAGRLAHAEAKAHFEEVIAQTIAPLPEADQIELERLLGAIAANIEAALAEQPEPEAVGSRDERDPGSERA